MSTTIAISERTRNEIREFGAKGETYDDILERLLKSAKDRQLQELLMDERDTVPVSDALKKAKKRWQK
ncbi:hypothetical protein GF345_05320 [Candidatus Woesearchaeota archaeon]|nr:hypothetical protein [Candidatus Woesearchaeota archaeon]